MVQDNRKWMRCGNCGREHLEGPCPQYGDPRIAPKGESNRSLKASLAAERSELDRLHKQVKMFEAKAAGSLANNLCPDHRDKVFGHGCLLCEADRLRKENAALREALTLIFDLASQEWEERDGSLKGAVDNQGRRMWFISQDLMETARATLQGAKDD